MSALDLIQSILAGLAAIFAAVASYYTYKLRKLRIQVEESTKSIQERQSQLLGEMSEFGNAIIQQTLKVAPQFAFSPYQQLLSTTTLTDMSLFDRRRSHFTPEKELLADVIVKRISSYIDKDDDLFIILILDAGSTVYPIFRRLCRHPSFQFDRNKARRLKIITNNLPGVADLIRYGHIGDPSVARTLFQCRILSGFAHSQYEASLSNETAADLLKAVSEFRESIRKDQPQADKVKVISVTTGNYISIKEGVLARDRNHVDTKSNMIEVASEIYVLAPLGKLLPYNCDEINNLLEFNEDMGYATLPKWDERFTDRYIVITTRQPEYFPQLNPLTLITYFGRVQGEVNDHYKDNLLKIPFDPMDDIQVRTSASILGRDRALREYELPHQNLRDKLIKKLQNEQSST
jgi:hypothetical protein